MKTYKYLVTVSVEVQAFDESDAWDAIQDNFGVGEQSGLIVTNCEYKETK